MLTMVNGTFCVFYHNKKKNVIVSLDTPGPSLRPEPGSCSVRGCGFWLPSPAH